MDKSGIPIPLGGTWGIALGAMAYVLPYLLLKKDKTMTPLEKAFTGLVGILCQRVTEYESTIEHLRTELVDRPTRQELVASQKKQLELGDKVHVLERELESLRSIRDRQDMARIPKPPARKRV